MASAGVSMTRARWIAAGCGVISAAATLAVAELVSLFVAPASSPLFAVGAWVVDLTPPWFKEWVIGLVGTGDKALLFLCLAALLLVLAAAAGIAELVRPPAGAVVVAVIGAVAVVAVVTRPGASVVWATPTVIGVAVGIGVLRQALDRLRRWRRSAATGAIGAGLDRRAFLTFVGVSAAGAAVVGIGARIGSAGTRAVTQVRQALRLPTPAVPAPAVPAGAELKVPGITPFVTPNSTFYRIDTALQVPAVDSATWKLHVGGMVENEVELGFDELLALPLTEHMATLACVSNEVGGDLIGNARWLGYPIRNLLQRAAPRPGADMVLSRSADGWTAGTPLDVLLDEKTDALLAVGMNGKPLPLEHGFPVRMVVPGLYGYVSATKWVVELTVTRFADAMGYWTDKGWSARGPIKTQSRIDTPRGSRISAGPTMIAGVAWAQHTGIAAVEVRIDKGPWQTARLADSVSADTWRQWVLPWDAPAGSHILQVRATDESGYTQTAASAPPAPDGATGWHTVRVTAG